MMTKRRREDLALELFRRVSVFDAVAVRLTRHGIAAGMVACIAILGYAAYVVLGLRAPGAEDGTTLVSGLNAPVEVVRDARDIPHLRAASERDLFAAQGYVEGSDRFFQMELTRRYAYGRLAEVLGSTALMLDESQRLYDLRDAAEREWRRMDPQDRAAVQAFTAGVNAALRTRPLPVEFRLLLYRPQPWRPQDCVAVSLAVSIALSDSWRDVLARDQTWRRLGPRAFERYFPLSDPAYDVSVDGSPERGAPSAMAAAMRAGAVARATAGARPAVAVRPGSNAWAAGGARTVGHRALLANDPHLDLTIPGLWYLIDLQSPGFHAAGASIPGAPGVLLGHNERLAWGATNADVASTSLFEPGKLSRRDWVREVFHVRFARDVVRAYYRTPREYGVSGDESGRLVLARAGPCAADCAGIATFLALDRSLNVQAALRVLARYGGAAENFVLADASGAVAYHLAGRVVDDPAWGRYVHPARELRRQFAAIAFGRLPSAAPSRGALVITANNKMYEPGYPFRLAAAFDPPYRAYRIAELLRRRQRYDAQYFERMQLDTVSAAELELAHSVVAYARASDGPAMTAIARELAAWNGGFSPDSRAATLVHRLREALEADAPSLTALLAELRRGSPDATVDADVRATLYDAGAVPPWGVAGAVNVDHPLAPLRFAFLNGPGLPGQGDEYTIRLQEPGFAQSFRAVWDVGNWDAGGIAIPSGESGAPGSGHYTDLTPAWIAGRLTSLPFSAAAVRSAQRSRVLLVPPHA